MQPSSSAWDNPLNISAQVADLPTFAAVIWFAVGLLIMRVIWRFGFGMLKSMTSTLPPPPPTGEMRRINVRYRCSVCGVELRLTLAPDEDPPPPRHCLEDMDIVAPID
jgi:hypothetical protein